MLLLIEISEKAYKAACENDEFHSDLNYLMARVREGKIRHGIIDNNESIAIAKLDNMPMIAKEHVKGVEK